MRPLPKEARTELVQTGLGRAVIIPDDFVLEGGQFIVRQERDGLITIFPGTEYGRDVMLQEFGLFDDNGDGAATVRPRLLSTRQADSG